MSLWLILTPLASAIIGWVVSSLFIRMLFRPRVSQTWLGIRLQGTIPKRQPELAALLGNIVNREFMLAGEIQESILDPVTLEKITPEIEMHIDYFLRVKLNKAMPMVAMFVGDKTITQLKEIFMTEMKTLFPVIMKSYVGELQKDLNIGERVTSKLASLPLIKIELFLLKTLKKELRYVQVVGFLMGLIIGAFQLLLILLIQS